MPAKNNINPSLPLFTIICRYKDGTYVEQFQAPDAKDAIQTWSSMLLLGKTPIPKDEIASVSAELNGEEPLLIRDCINAWVATAFPSSGPVWLDIIKTESQ